MKWIRNLFTDNYNEGYADGYMAACKTIYERQQRREDHNPKTCEYCRPKNGCSRPECPACQYQREASQEA